MAEGGSRPLRRWSPPGSRRYRAEGRAALDRLSAGAVLTATDPDRFRAEVVRVDLGEVAVERVRATPFTARGHANEEARHLVVSFLVHGTVRRLGGADRDLVLHAGTCSVHRDSDDFAIEAQTPVEILRAVTSIDRFPSNLVEAAALPRLTTSRDLVAGGLVGLLGSVAEAPPEDADVASTHLARAVSELVSAVLIALGEGGAAADDDTVDRMRVLEYIERHLADPATSPDTIATELGIGRRRLYRLFEEDEHSIAAHIRRRRLDGVAAAVAGSRDVPALGRLAERFGFSSTDALSRNFRERYGTTVRAFHAGTARERDRSGAA